MKIDKNDPRLTAYVLNELDPADKALIEAALKTDSELRAEVQLIRKSTDLLQSLSTQESHRLSPAQRDALFPRTKPKLGWLSLSGGFVTAALAVVLFQRGQLNETVHQEYNKPQAAAPAAARKSAPVEVAAAPEPPSVAAKEVVAEAEAPAPAKEEIAADFAARSSDIGAVAAAGSGGSEVYAASAPRSKKMFAASASGALNKAIPSFGEVVISQIRPKEADPEISKVLENSLKSGLQKCFSENLSKSAKYHLVFNLKLALQNGAIADWQIADTANSPALTVELQDCITNLVINQTWPAVSKQFEFVLIFDSN